jgi:hypothetical protein
VHIQPLSFLFRNVILDNVRFSVVQL